MTVDLSVYFITDRATAAAAGRSVLDTVRLAVSGGATAVQVRDKDERLDDAGSLYELLSTAYGVVVDAAEQTVAIAHLSASDARSLATEAGAPCFAITRTARDRMGTVVEFGRSLYRGDRYQLEMHVSTEAPNP